MKREPKPQTADQVRVDVSMRTETQILDATPRNEVQTPAIPKLARGEVFLFQYPADGNNEGAYFHGYHRCLVTDIFDNRSGPFGELCRGSAKIALGLPNQLHFNARATFQAVGVYLPISFDLNQRIIVTMRNPGFMTKDDYDTPVVIGRLAREDFDRMNAIGEKLIALRNFARARRREAALPARSRDTCK